MTRNARRALAVVLVTIVVAGLGASQQTARLAGTWDVHIEHYTGRVVNEQWILTQDGASVTGKVVVSSREYPLEGTVDGTKINFKVTVRPDSFNIFLGTVEGDSIKGEIKKLNDDGTFAATRARR